LEGDRAPYPAKIQLADYEKEGKPIKCFGRDIVTGLPVMRQIPTDLIDESLLVPFSKIIDNIKLILERTPPELGADIYRNGIYLTGGASQVSHLAALISKASGLKVNISEDPINSVIAGVSKVIKEEKYRKLAYTIEGMSI
jgi:rod shape-determining protein MreB